MMPVVVLWIPLLLAELPAPDPTGNIHRAFPGPPQATKEACEQSIRTDGLKFVNEILTKQGIGFVGAHCVQTTDKNIVDHNGVSADAR